MRRLALIIALTIAASGAGACGGEYVQSDRIAGRAADRGEVNGRTFDFVSNKAEGDDWSVRLRGTSMFVSYGNDDTTDKVGSIALTDKEGRKAWRLIDRLDLPHRPSVKRGKKTHGDVDFVTLVLRTPTAEGDHDVAKVTQPRADDDVDKLASYLAELVKKYKGEAPPL